MGAKSLSLLLGAAALAARAAFPDEIRYSAYPSSHPSAGSDCRKLANDWPSPFTNAVCWSDGLEPHNGATYIAGKIDGANSVLWTPIQGAATTYDMFDTLVLESGCTLCIRHANMKSATFNDLRVTGGGTVDIYCPDVDKTIIAGGMYIEDGTTNQVRSYNNNKFCISSDLTGGGLLRFVSQSGTSAYKAIYELHGNNLGFRGKISASTGAGASERPTLAERYSTLSITNANSLGGVLDAFTYDALTLERMSVLVVDGCIRSAR